MTRIDTTRINNITKSSTAKTGAEVKGMVARFLERWFWLLLAALVAGSGVLEVASALGETQTWDEGIHIAAGYAYLTRGDFRWNQEHPPLAKLMSALPLLRLGLELPVETPGWGKLDETQMGIDFLYHNRAFLHHNGIGADTILIRARSATMLLWLIFLIAAAWLVRRRFGAAAALLTAALCAYDPNLLAHARYVTTDLPVTVFYFFAVFLWMEYLLSGRLRELLLASLAFALALATKFSALLLLPAMVIVYAVRWAGGKPVTPGRDAAVLAGTTILVISLLYWPETIRSFSGEMPRLASVVARGNPIGKVLYRAGRWFHLPAHPFLVGLGKLAQHNQDGHDSYLLGMRSAKGWWYYFPVAFAVKSTMAALAASALLLAVGLCSVRRWIEIRFVWCGLLIPPLVYFGISMSSAIDIGMRHILPVYPFLYLAAAVLLSERMSKAWARYAMLALAALQIGECASIAPDYLTFFNALSGGPGNGPRYLVDSNIDWGQDLKKLKRWLRVHGTNTVWIRYFGNAQMDYYGINAMPFPDPLDAKGWDAIDGYAVASVTALQGVYVPLNQLAPLRLRDPIAKVGWSLYVYDLRKRPGD
jgi:Dolichyl-phosphate-mannose-protein mannosyltransferase